jgi:hypothetical protein
MTQEGMVVITDPPAFIDERAPVLDAIGTVKVSEIESKWGGICRTMGGIWNVPDGWLQAMIYRESGGDPEARHAEGGGWIGVGLLQITHPSLKGARRTIVDGKVLWVKPRPDTEIASPATNIYIGAKYIHELISRYGRDFPAVSAAFNHGSVDPSHLNPWGMVATGNHITEEVAALNTWLKLEREALKLITARTLIDLTDLARREDEAARKDTDPPPDAA